MKKILFIFLTIAIFLIKNAFCTHCLLTEDDVRGTFPKVTNTRALQLDLLAKLDNKSPVLLAGVTKVLPEGYTLKKAAGLTFNNLSELHCRALRHSLDKNALDLGAGNGYFTAKMALNAAHTHAIELSPTSARNIRDTLNAHQRFSSTPLSVSIQNADIADPNSFSTEKLYDVITIFNVFHYQTPQQVSLTLKNCQSLLRDRDSRIYIVMNAITPWSDINKFAQIAANVGREWPGHISYESVESCDDAGNQQFIIQKPKSLPFEHTIDPLMVCITYSTNEKGRPIAIVKNSYFLGDIGSLRKIFLLTNLAIEDIYYQTPLDGRCDELTPEIIKKSTFGIDLCIVAKLSEPSTQPCEIASPPADPLL